ncbi:helix-turn-helix domain-containing protein [Acidovorax sp. M2(2025)]|uniref:helix-turn-helix domain-containing protein n=1 Tax=Acidovorax sp. M2(2025) TaxID=3411355 RepID=UPI003BF50D86
MSIFSRLREERERLGLTQEAFGTAGGVLKRAVINYEKGERFPDVSFLAGVANAGADVLYIVTGKRGSESAGVLSEAESTLLTRWRNGSPVLRGYLQEVGQAPAGGGHSVTIGGDVGQHVSGDQRVAGPMTFNLNRKAKK